MPKKRKLFYPVIVGLLFFLIFLASIADAEIPTNETYPKGMFITIDPIGNHTIGEVFFINGTTNLPISENLTMEILTFYQPHSPDFYYLRVENISIASSGNSEVDYWSINVTDGVKKKLAPGKYYITVWGAKNIWVRDEITFSLLPNPNETTVPQTTFINQFPILPTTKLTTMPSSTQSSPLPIISPIAIIAVIVILNFVRTDKPD